MQLRQPGLRRTAGVRCPGAEDDRRGPSAGGLSPVPPSGGGGGAAAPLRLLPAGGRLRPEIRGLYGGPVRRPFAERVPGIQPGEGGLRGGLRRGGRVF